MSGNLNPGMDPDEAERRQYAALTETLAKMLDLRAGLADAINVADYAGAGSHFARLKRPTGLRSALAIRDPATRLDVAYQLDRTAVTTAEADWLARLPDASPDEQDDAMIELRANAHRGDADRKRLHLIGMGLAALGRPEEAISFFVRASELDPATGVDAVNAAVALMRLGDFERARLWLAPIAQGDGELSDVATRFITEIDRARQMRREHPPETEPKREPTTIQVNELLQSATLRGADAQLAVHSLRMLVRRYPDNEYYRETLMFALMAHSEIAEALTQAEILEARPEPSHDRHFNLAQAFWHGGDRQRAYYHFALAHELAKTDEERHDVISMLEYLRAQDELFNDD